VPLAVKVRGLAPEITPLNVNVLLLPMKLPGTMVEALPIMIAFGSVKDEPPKPFA
jgi:hypothetical protein